ncbi:MAG: sigma-70 family RNA polymerase sigma factor, partial [Bacteroidales bacterium]|nr:sigma-70 family RNA polymerase sigma factor [Bacteroidales bacterium]
MTSAQVMPDIYRPLVEKCQKGDKRAQEELYKALSGKMYAVCLRYVGQNDAEDVLQEGFVTLFEKLGSFKSEGSFEGWARRVFTTTALMFLRKNDVLKHSEDITEAYTLFAKEPEPASALSYQEILKIMES